LAATNATPAATSALKKLRLSAAGRRAIAEAAKRRWAVIETANASPKKAPRRISGCTKSDGGCGAALMGGGRSRGITIA